VIGVVVEGSGRAVERVPRPAPRIELREQVGGGGREPGDEVARGPIVRDVRVAGERDDGLQLRVQDRDVGESVLANPDAATERPREALRNGAVCRLGRLVEGCVVVEQLPRVRERIRGRGLRTSAGGSKCSTGGAPIGAPPAG